MVKELTIRLARESDIPMIENLANEWTPTTEYRRKLRIEKLKSTFNMQGHEFHVAEKDNKIVGYVEIWVHECWFPLRFVVYIEFIFVHPNYRNQNIGTNFIEYIKAKYKDGVGLPNIWIYAEGIITEFYTKTGFRKADVNFYLMENPK